MPCKPCTVQKEAAYPWGSGVLAEYSTVHAKFRFRQYERMCHAIGEVYIWLYHVNVCLDFGVVYLVVHANVAVPCALVFVAPCHVLWHWTGVLYVACGCVFFDCRRLLCIVACYHRRMH